MDKSPQKKVKMMDIVRKQPGNEAPVRRDEEHVKFSIEKKPAAEHIRAFIDEREARRERGEADEIVQRPREAVHTDEHKHSGHKEPAHTHEEPDEEPEEEVEEAPVHHHAAHPEPHMLEMRANHEEEHMMPEVSSIEMDRPIAYIPKEKPSREERKVLERIERRERSSREHEHAGRKEGGKKRGVLVWLSACVVLGALAYVVIMVLPRVEIALTPKTFAWPAEEAYTNPIGASTKIAEVDPIARQIPVAVFAEKKTNTFSYPATGAEKSIERKATGEVTVYNNFSTVQQPLVAGTRLETPDGKVFRLKDRIVVPGATSAGGTLTPASIRASVVADKAGEAYNISPVSKFTIPGFAGTPKFDGFYAESKDSMTGGFIGTAKYPTAADIKAGKEDAEKQMKGLIDTFLATQVVPEGFKSIDSSKKYTITKELVNETVDDKGNFSIYMEAEGTVDALKEEHVLKLMTLLARQAQANNADGYEIKEIQKLSYGSISIDEKSGAITLPIEFKGVFWKPIDIDQFRKEVIGKTEDDLKTYIFSSTSIEKADVALWPFWVRKVPTDPERVKVELK